MFEYAVITHEEKSLLKYKTVQLKKEILAILNRLNTEVVDTEELNSQVQFSLMNLNHLESLIDSI